MSKKPLRDLGYGVYAVTSVIGSRHVGCIANSAMQITSKPATIALSMNHDNFTNGAISESGIFAISILPETVDSGIIGTFGFQSSRDIDKFENIAFSEKEGVRVLNAAVSFLVCRVVDKMETSTHTVFLGEVIDSDELSEGEPLSYAYYHNVVKGKSPKNAPTYIEEEKTSDKWVCSICGYVYNGETPFEELSDSYTCPVCSVPKKLFEKR